MGDKTSSNDEIDLGQLIQTIKKIAKYLFEFILRLFLYLKSKWPILIGLIVLGGVVGFSLNKIVSKRYTTDVIIKPNLSSKAYVYDVIDELQAKIRARDTAFFQELDMDIEYLKGYKIEVEPISHKYKGADPKLELQFMNILADFEYKGIIPEVIETEILNKSRLNHRLSFRYKNAEKGQEYAHKIIKYINSNAYFSKLIQIYSANAIERIAKNDTIIRQIDGLIGNFSKKLAANTTQNFEGRLVLDNDERLNITDLIQLKTKLIGENESKKLELERRKEPITVLNFSNPYQENMPLFNNNIFLIPMILLSFYFLFSMLRYLNKRAKIMVEENNGTQ